MDIIHICNNDNRAYWYILLSLHQGYRTQLEITMTTDKAEPLGLVTWGELKSFIDKNVKEDEKIYIININPLLGTRLQCGDIDGDGNISIWNK